MPSSTSSSDARLPRAAWGPVLFGALALWAAFVAAMELRLAARGFRPTVVDSEALWLKQRERAAALGSRALILVGASRIQLDIDLDVLRRRTGLEPVQLAIDGSSFVPVLRSLADDPRVCGTIVVDFAENVVGDPARRDAADIYAADYARLPVGATVPDYAWSEALLTDFVRDHLRSYADGARPLTSLLLRILPAGATPQYLVTLPDRSRLADYAKVPMPGFYYARVMRNMGQEVEPKPGMTWNDLDAELRRRIGELQPADARAFEQGASRILGMADRIAARGGRVLFVLMPRGGLVAAADDRFFPRTVFWDRFAARSSYPAVSYADVPALRDFGLPDGSHLDFRDRPRFTNSLVDALGLSASRAGGGATAATAAH